MTPSEIVYKLMKDTGTTQVELTQKMGYKSQGTISNMLGRDNMKVSTFLSILDTLGYEMSIRPKVVEDVRTEIVVNQR